MKPHPLDRAVAWMSRNSRMFSRGWGDEALLTELSSRTCYLTPPPAIEVQWREPQRRGNVVCRDGKFASPLQVLPQASSTVHVCALTRAGNAAACVMPAASRDEGYRAREHVFGPLVQRGIDLYLLENPFYGLRRDGRGPADISVADHGLMALGMVLESRALLEYLRPRYKKLAVAGYSMGGHMAAITAAVIPLPIACAVMSAGASASAIYTHGLLSRSVDFATLGSSARERLNELFSVADINCFRPPIRPDAAIVAGCTRDGYVLNRETERLHAHWKGSRLRWINAGHFSALVTQRRALQACVEEAVRRL